MPLEAELAFYASMKDQLLQNHEGKFVLIIGQEQMGIFDDSEDAYRQGIELRGNVPMLIKKLEREDQIESVPAMVLGLIDAHL